VFVNAFHPGVVYPLDKHQVTVSVVHAGVLYRNSDAGFARVQLAGLSAGDRIGVSDTHQETLQGQLQSVTQSFMLGWEARPSATLGVCPGSSSVAGLLSAPQGTAPPGSPGPIGPSLSFVTARLAGSSNAQTATTTQNGNTYRATFVSPLVPADLIDAADQWEAIVSDTVSGSPIDVTMQSVHETVVANGCAATGGGTSGNGGTPGVPTPGLQLQLAGLDLSHGLRDLLRGGLIVTLVVGCPPGDTCGIAINVVGPNHVPVQAAARRRKRRKPKRQAFDTLGRGYLTVGTSGSAQVKVRATRTGKRRLKGKRQATLVLVVTVRDKQAGTFSTVKQTVTMHR
jgi:hypothetical protein